MVLRRKRQADFKLSMVAKDRLCVPLPAIEETNCTTINSIHTVQRIVLYVYFLLYLLNQTKSVIFH